MGKKSRKKGKPKKTKPDFSGYEGFTSGPLKIERFGRMIKYSSHWKPGEHKKHMEYIRDKRPEFKNGINEKITEILTLINTYEPLQFLAPISLKNCFVDPETYTEITHKGSESVVEYALSLILSQEHKPGLQDASEEVIDRFNQLIEEIINSVLWYFGSEVTEKKRDKEKDELRFLSILKYLYIRGESFPEHHWELWQEIFKEHDAFFQEHYGMTSAGVLDGIQNIENQILTNIRAQGSFISTLHEMHGLFIDFIDKEGEDSFSSIEECREKYHELPAVQEKQKELNKEYQMTTENPFEIIPNKKITTELLNLLSAEFGENKAFAEFKKSPAWPTNGSVIYVKPLIKCGNQFYCYMPQLMFRNISNILENWLLEKDSEYYINVYSKKRSEYLERKALNYFRTILPDSQVYSGLKYYEKDGAAEYGETDGLILYDNNIFLIEGKAGSLSLSARRGSLERMKKDAAALIDDAYKQALRTKSFILESNEPVFYNSDGSAAFAIKDRSFYRNVYLVNVTLAGLGKLSTELNSLKTFGLVRGKEWLWSVFINDLRTISELIEIPSIFLHFLQRRLKANDYPQFQSSDELDFLMFYFKDGLFFDGGIIDKMDVFTPLGYTEKLDRYYDFLAGRVSSGQKPVMNIPEEYKELVKGIEITQKPSFTEVTTTLLDFDRETMGQIIGSLEKLKESLKKDGHDHDLTLLFNKDKMGVTFSVASEVTPEYWQKMQRHCRLKMYQTKYDKWILVVFEIKDGKRQTDFQIFENKWEFDSLMETQLQKFKEWKFAQFQKKGGTVGRNDPCPCDSGIKYKKCCGR